MNLVWLVLLSLWAIEGGKEEDERTAKKMKKKKNRAEQVRAMRGAAK